MKHRLGTIFHWAMLGCYVGAYNYWPIAEAVGYWGIQSLPFYGLGGTAVVGSLLSF